MTVYQFRSCPDCATAGAVCHAGARLAFSGAGRVNGGMSKKTGPAVIKKYPNRRLYNTATSVYVTLDDLCQMIKNNEDFSVQDAKSGDDITRSVLTQIIVEQDAKGENLLPISFLKQLISFYDDQMRHVLPSYLEQAMSQFHANQKQIDSYLKESIAPHIPPGAGLQTDPQSWEDITKRNVAVMEQAMRNMTQMFLPFSMFGKK